MLSRSVLPVAIVSLLAACGGSAPAGGGGDEGAGTAGGSSTGGDGGGSTGGVSPGGSDGGTAAGSGSDDGGSNEDVPARGIRISLVEANPGVAIAIAKDGAWIDGGHRNAPLPKNRDTAFRVYLDVDDASWVSRKIEARLTMTQANGDVSTYSQIETVSEDSSTTSLQSNILVGVLADDMQTGAKVQIELYEAGTGWESLPEASDPPRAFDAGDQLVGIQATDQNMRLVMVPIAYEHGSCSTTPDLTPEALKPYEDAMFQQNPLESIDIQVHEPMPVTDLDLTNSNDFFTLLNRVVQLRAQDGPDPNVYYFGLFDNCGGCIGDGGGCLLGVAPGQPGPTQGEAMERAAIGVRYLGQDEVGAETFVHEIGHTQGRAHVACPGVTAAAPDPTYPYEGGIIGVWGFGVRDFQIRNASTHTDYMSYCNPVWVSDWQWSATFDRVATLTKWDQMQAPVPTTSMLVGTYNSQTGESHWWTEPGLVDDADAQGSDTELALLSGDDTLHRAKADVDGWSEGPWVTVRANLPAEAMVAATDAFELRMPAKTHRFTPERVRFDLAASKR